MANLVLRTADKLILEYPDRWTSDFEKNKQKINELKVINSKTLRNKITGAVTRMVKSEEKKKEF